jgi:hypothetical protein
MLRRAFLMRRTSLLYTMALAGLIASQASAQSLRDIVRGSEGGGIPSQAEFQQRHPADPGNGPRPEPQPNLGSGPVLPDSRSASPGAEIATPTSCIPPGMPALSELVSVGHQLLVAPVEGSDDTVMVNAVGLVTRDHLAQYHGGEMALDFIAYYVRGHLAAVDDHPGDPGEPDLVDTGMVSPRGGALAQGTPVCQWVRLQRPPDDGRAASPTSRI